MDFELNVALASEEDNRELAFGNCGVFDIYVAHVDDMPFEIPVQSYLEEMLLGMHGCPENEAGEKKASARLRKHWTYLKDMLETAVLHDACSALFWIVVGVVTKQVSESVVDALRRRLAKLWAQVALDVREKAVQNSHGVRRTEVDTQDWLLRALPVLLVQCIYRLLVDAFADDKAQLAGFGENLLEKLTHTVTYEVTGFQLNKRTWLSERKLFFRRAVIDNPLQNQLEALKSQARKEFLENRSKDTPPLVFGRQETAPLDDTQLEHIMQIRAATKQELLEAHEKRSPSKTFEPPIPEELSVERYDSVVAQGDELLQRHLQELMPETMQRPSLGGTASQGVVVGEVTLDMGTNIAGNRRDAGANRRDVDIANISSASPSLSKQERRDAEEREKRRREDLLKKRVVEEPLPTEYCERRLDTTWVSPIGDRLIPSKNGNRQGLCKRSSESYKLKMELPPLVHSQSEPVLTSQPSNGHKLPKIHGHQAANHADGDLSASLGSSFMACSSEKKQSKPKFFEITMEPPASLKNEKVLHRLTDHLVHFNSNSFGVYKNEYDMNTGEKKYRMDPLQLGRAENKYVSSMQKLVGGPKEPGLKLIHLNDNSPSRKAKRTSTKA